MPMWVEPPHGAQDFIDENFNLHDKVVVIEDGGGLVEKYQYFVMKYNFNSDTLEVRVKGECHSACTLALGVKNLCVYPEANFQWHYAYNYDTGEIDKSVTKQMLSAIPQKISKIIDGKLTRGYNKKATLSGEQLIALGVRECKE